MVLAKALGGQTISKAEIKLDGHGAKLTLDLINTVSPATLQWTNDGSIVFGYKDREYTIRRGK